MAGKLAVVTVYDTAVSAYMQPFFTRTKGEAIRAFVDAVNDAKSPFYMHPKDYVLMFVGWYVEDTGRFEYEKATPEPLMTALNAKEYIANEGTAEYVRKPAPQHGNGNMSMAEAVPGAV